MSERRPVAVVILAAMLAGCAPRVEVVDVISGLPLAAQVSELDHGRLLVAANGYESWSGPAQAQVALHPLWVRRFTEERITPRRLPPPPCPGCSR